MGVEPTSPSSQVWKNPLFKANDVILILSIKFV